MCYFSVTKTGQRRIQMNYKMVYSDVDGTLLNDAHEMTEKTREAILRLNEKGIPFAIASARSPMGIEAIVKSNRFRCCVVAYNGALILDENRRVLYENGMSAAAAKQIIQFMENERFDLTWNIYTADAWLVKDCQDPRVVREERIVKSVARQGLPESLKMDTVVDKILCMCAPGTIEKVEQCMKEKFPEYEIVKSSDILLEIMKKGMNKANAMKRLCEMCGIPVEQAIAFGDNYNDMEMLQAAGCGYLMENAPEELKAHWRYITKSNNQDGIAVALKKVCAL